MTTDSIDNWINYHFMYESYLFKHAPCDSASFQKAKSCTAVEPFGVEGETAFGWKKCGSASPVWDYKCCSCFQNAFPTAVFATVLLSIPFYGRFRFPLCNKIQYLMFLRVEIVTVCNPDFGSIICRHFEPYSDSSKTQHIFLLGSPKNWVAQSNMS